MKIVLEHLTKRFPNRNKKLPDVIAVNDFNLEIPDGKLVGLLGPSGCGKSTALNLLCGLQKPTEGKIFFGDDDVTNLPAENRGVGFVFQNYALYPHLTVRQNITFPLENLKGKDKLTKEAMNEKALEAAKTNEDKLAIVADQYDMVMNGYEVASGAVRNYNPEIMYKVFNILGYNNEYVEARFGGMLNAFKFGAPPHAGCAPGLDRIFMILEDEDNIRDIVAFPKNGNGVDLMMNSPSEVDQIQLDEAHLAIIPDEDD